MKFYLGYRYTGANKDILKSFLLQITDLLESLGHSTFIYFRDGSNWEKREGAIPLNKVMKQSFDTIKTSDAVLIILQSNDFSEGMLLDLGCAFAHQKPVYLCKQAGTSLPKSEALASQVIEYSDPTDLLAKLKSNFS